MSSEVTMAKAERTYGQYCPIAAGLDVVGDRWVLLICRELLMGDRRFTDLRTALPGIAPNLLTERLRALQAEGPRHHRGAAAAGGAHRLPADRRRVAPWSRCCGRWPASASSSSTTSRARRSPPAGRRTRCSCRGASRSTAELRARLVAGPGRRGRPRARRHRHGDRRGRGRRRRDARGHPRRSRPGPPGARAAATATIAGARRQQRLLLEAFNLQLRDPLTGGAGPGHR